MIIARKEWISNNSTWLWLTSTLLSESEEDTDQLGGIKSTILTMQISS